MLLSLVIIIWTDYSVVTKVIPHVPAQQCEEMARIIVYNGHGTGAFCQPDQPTLEVK